MIKNKFLLIILITLFIITPCWSQEPPTEDTHETATENQAKEIFDFGMDDYNIGDHAAAILDFEDAIKLNYLYFDAHEKYIECLIVKNRLDDGIKFYQHLGCPLPWDKKMSGIYYGLGKCYLKKNEIEEAKKYFQMAINKDPKNKFTEKIRQIDKMLEWHLLYPSKSEEEKYLQWAFIAGFILLIFIVIGPVRSYIISLRPKFTGRIVLVNPEGIKITDELVDNFFKSDAVTIGIGSNTELNGIVIPDSERVHAVLIAEKLVNQYRVRYKSSETAKNISYYKGKRSKR